MTRIWPWSIIHRLAVEVRAARRSCAAEAKRCNRLAARIVRLDAAILKHRRQERHDQAYIDALEHRLGPKSVERARQEIAVRLSVEAAAGEPVDYHGPDESVECGYPPCTNRLRRSSFDEPQFCSKEHRKAAAGEETR